MDTLTNATSNPQYIRIYSYISFMTVLQLLQLHDSPSNATSAILLGNNCIRHPYPDSRSLNIVSRGKVQKIPKQSAKNSNGASGLNQLYFFK